jgi:hypothetical protein
MPLSSFLITGATLYQCTSVFSVFFWRKGQIVRELKVLPDALTASLHRSPDIRSSSPQTSPKQLGSVGLLARIANTDVPSNNQVPMTLRLHFLLPATSTALDLGHMHCFFIGQQALAARRLMISRGSPAGPLSSSCNDRFDNGFACKFCYERIGERFCRLRRPGLASGLGHGCRNRHDAKSSVQLA